MPDDTPKLEGSGLIAMTETENRAQKVVKLLLEGVSPRQALLDVGYSEGTARCSTHQTIERAIKNSGMALALEEAGLTRSYLARVIKRATRAKRVQRLVVGNEVKQFTDIDHGMRVRAAEVALKYRGEEPDRKIEGTEESYEQRVRRLRAAGTAALGQGKG